MRITISIDDFLISQAQTLTGERELEPLLNAALTALIQRARALRLAALAVGEPNFRKIPRRRSS